ncbi:MAG: hypothetical protein LUD48_05495 [Prevotella sp.]|nr:hypothetical protein [Prevotella sp.]
MAEGLPQDINAEILLNYYEGRCIHVKFNGLHKRNVYKDILGIETDKNLLHLCRNSIYNLLPEYMFHSNDRFDNLPPVEIKERFAEEYARQEKEKEDAYRYFAPFDILLLQLRLEIRKTLDQYVVEDKVLQDILSDRVTAEQKSNRFIRKTIPYLPSCKKIRGDRTLLTLLLRKVLMDEGIRIEIKREEIEFSDDEPRYEDREGAIVGDVYAGNRYNEQTLTYRLCYWQDECDEKFPKFIEDMEEYRQFIQDYLLSVETLLIFDIHKDAAALRLSDTTIYNYLNYNTNL